MLASSIPLQPNKTGPMPRPSEYHAYESGLGLLKNTYRYLGQIQKGSFGQVTLAINVNTNTKVAMKAMHKVREVAPMARHEIRVLRKLGHGNDHICQLVDNFETEEFIVLVLEYCANGDMYDIIHSGNVGPSAVDVLNLARELHLGLTYAHSLGIYHRDIKPENILFTETGRVKICDWGLATYTRHASDFNVGTEKYMAPECFLNSPVNSGVNPSGPGSKSTDSLTATYDCKYADYWSVGVTLLTAVFGLAPFKPVRAHETSGDDFRRKNRSVKKSLESDCNFRNFVLYNMPEVLYDIYPTMNANCFRIFMNVLQVGGVEDDLASYTRKIQLRSLDKLVADLEANWKFGLTVWEEEEMDAGDDTINHDSVFDMDDFDRHEMHLSEKNEKNKHDEKKDVKETHDEHDEIHERDGHDVYDKDKKDNRTALPDKFQAGHSIPVPSLVESTGPAKSWYDLQDDLDDAEFTKLFHSLSFRNAAPVKFDAPKAANSNIHIVEKELVEGLSWSDY